MTWTGIIFGLIIVFGVPALALHIFFGWCWINKRIWTKKIEKEAKRIIREEQDRTIKEIETILLDREKTYKWLSPLIADIKTVLKEQNRPYEETIRGKRYPESQAKVSVLIQEKKKLEKENATLRYSLEYIKALIPETEEMVDFDEHKTENADNPNHFLAKGEYIALSDKEKNKRALEYYKTRNKRDWEIGRDFERFIGYEYEKLGYEVEYFGIEKRLEDLGRDLIAKKGNDTLIIQCKYWSKNKTIHEKHIAQLYGTTIVYELRQQAITLPRTVRGVFVTHTILSEEAKRFAKYLNIEIIESKELGEYPAIKCKVGKNRETGKITKIYHLPMDQQYDATKIDKENGDCYVFTIDEAETKGFRRAYHWSGEDPQDTIFYM